MSSRNTLIEVFHGKDRCELMQFKDVPLRTRRALSLYKNYVDSELLVLNAKSLNIVNALVALSRRYSF